MRQSIGAKILGVCMLVVAIFTVLNVYSYGKSQQVTAGYRNVIDRNASLIFKVYAADVELARQATLLQRYLATGADQHRQALLYTCAFCTDARSASVIDKEPFRLEFSIDWARFGVMLSSLRSSRSFPDAGKRSREGLKCWIRRNAR